MYMREYTFKVVLVIRLKICQWLSNLQTRTPLMHNSLYASAAYMIWWESLYAVVSQTSLRAASIWASVASRLIVASFFPQCFLSDAHTLSTVHSKGIKSFRNKTYRDSGSRILESKTSIPAPFFSKELGTGSSLEKNNTEVLWIRQITHI